MKKIIVLSTWITVLVVVVLAGFFVVRIRHALYPFDDMVRSPANYQPAALELVKLCQSDPNLFNEQAISYLDEFDPVWAPPSVAKLHPEAMNISADHATVIWGGGFYHCGWNLARGPATADHTGYSWTLSYYSEGSQDMVLETIDVGADQRLTEDQFISQLLAEFDRRLASHADDGLFTSEATSYLAAARCVFLEKHNRVDLLPEQIQKAAANYPHDWRDVLLGYLLDHAAGDRLAGDKLRRWAGQTTGPAAWVYAAYAFYQSGDITAGDIAITKAAAAKSLDPDWIDKDVPLYGLGMAARLYASGNRNACARLCDGILRSPHRYFTTQASVQHMRDLATTSSTSRPIHLPEFDKDSSLDPFGGFDLSLIHAIPTSTSAPSTQP